MERSDDRLEGDDAASDAGGVGGNRSNPHAVELLARIALERLARREETAELSRDFLESLCGLLMSGDYPAAERIVEAMTADRPGHARLADGILTATARHLGRKWETDEASFAEVSIGVAQIFRLNQAFGQRNRPLTRSLDRRLALFATLPGQAHNLGLVLAAEAFRQEDWQVTLLLDTPSLGIQERVRRLRPEAVGLSVSDSDRKHRHARLIGELHALPLQFQVLLGGGAARDLARTLPKAVRVTVVSDIASALRAV